MELVLNVFVYLTELKFRKYAKDWFNYFTCIYFVYGS